MPSWRLSRAYPDGSTSDRAYHATGNLHQVKIGTLVADARVYDNGGRLATSTYGNGIVTTHSYRTDNLVSSINATGSVGNLAYTWDANKNKLTETISNVPTAVSNYGFTSGTSYDFEDRLTAWQRVTGHTQSWNLSSVGDWNSTTVNGTLSSRTHGPTHELLTNAGQAVTTDVKGNITVLPANLSSTGSSLGLAYDFDNKLKSVDLGNNGSVDVTFEYDALGRRVARNQGTNQVVYYQVDQQTFADYPRGGAAASPTYRYYWASYIDEPVARKATGSGGAVLYYHRNQQYSVYTLTNASGAVSERIAYTAYGQPTFLNAAGTVQTTSANNNRYTYTGREWDATIGLCHFRARWMSPVAGRFLTRDPIGYVGSRWGLYEYCRAKPSHYVDSSGLKGRGLGYDKWWDWYYDGGGVAHDLSEDSRIYNAWKGSGATQGAIRSLKNSLKDLVTSCGDCGETKTIAMATTASYPVDYAPGNFTVWDILFPIGNTTLTGSGSCTLATTCHKTKIGQEYTECNKTASFYRRKKCCSATCSGTLSLNDSFVDAADPFDREAGNQEFKGGTGYAFTARISVNVDVNLGCSMETIYDPFN